MKKRKKTNVRYFDVINNSAFKRPINLNVPISYLYARKFMTSSPLDGDAPLSRLRQVTQQRNTGKLQRVSPLEVVNFPVNSLNICEARKTRRRVIFAKGKQGGNHRPPVYTLKSLVRC